MVAKVCSHGTSSRSAAGKIYPALPKLRDQLQSRGRHGAPLHRETKRDGSRVTLERICQTSRVPAITERIARKVTRQATSSATELVAASSSMVLVAFASFSMNRLNRSESC